MRYLPLESSTESHVCVTFGIRTFSFDMPRAATFEDLADLLSRLAAPDAGPLISLSIEPRPSSVPRSIRTPMWHRPAAAAMPEQSPDKAIRGYISAYLKQTPRTYAEAERDHQLLRLEAGAPEVLGHLQEYPVAPRLAANEK